MRMLFVLFSLIHATMMHAQSYNVKIDTIVCEFSKRSIRQIVITIQNTGDDALWIWCDKKEHINDSLAIRDYLRMRHGGDFSLCESAFDGNARPLEKRAFYVDFLKYLPIGENFSFIIADTRKSKKVEETFLKQLYVLKNETVIKQCAGLDTDRSLRIINFSSPVIFIPKSSIVK